MDCEIKEKAIIYLQALVGQALHYGLKSPDMDLYDFGFGEFDAVMSSRENDDTICRYALHVICRFKIIWRNGERKIEKYYEDTSSEEFHSKIQRLIGMRVQRIGLSDKNDLWLDFGDCWIVFVTFEEDEESWRFFVPGTESPHLVASAFWLDFH